MEVRLVQAVWRWQRAQARRLGLRGRLRGGAVCFSQWFGSQLQATPHMHVLVPEAVWREDGAVVVLPPPDEEAVQAVLVRALKRVAKDWAEEETAFAEDEYEAMRQQALALPGDDGGPPARQRLVATAHGFSLHAGTWVHGNDREGLERLVRYGARGPVALSRLRALDDGRYEYTPKRGAPFRLTAEEFVSNP